VPGALARLVVASVLGLALAAGCGTVSPGVQAPASTVAAAPTSAALSASRPERLRIPAIDVDARGVIDLGLQADGSMEVPPDATTVGWYSKSPTPGEPGPAVLAAHVNWKQRKGAFADLKALDPGDEVLVDRADGTSARFRVERVEQYPKDRFPTRTVYGDVPGPELRLITCGGELDRAAHSYRDNIVVYARLA
jgi:sortase (surface protein transpeptidase)